jgi:DNA-binding LacI/PurR family transcriptional regulator
MTGDAAARTAPTIEQVAAESGVSRSTVSRVLNGSPKVSPDVLEAGRAAIDRLGYVPNRAARTLAARRTMAVALVVPEDPRRFFGDPYFAAIVQGISRELDDSDYVLTLQLVSPEQPSEKIRRYLLGGNVDGALVVSHHTGDRLLTSMSEGMPLVYGGRPVDRADDRSVYVDVDNLAAAVDATRYLVERGARRIATVTGPLDMPAAVDRLEGWRSVAGSDLHADGDFSMVGGARAMRELLDRAPDLDAVFVASDLMALGALGALKERGRRVPEDVAVIGFDDSPAATGGEVALTTVRQPSDAVGARMARTLLRMLAGEQVEREQILPTEIVVRESA